MPEPIPFLGWIADYEETENMLREQIHAQQNRILELEKLIMELMQDKDIQ